MTTRLAIMGGGNMGEALLNGLLEQQWAPADELAVVEVLPARREQLAARYPGLVVAAAPVATEAAVLAVKPNDAGAAMQALMAQGCTRVLSIAAGVTTATLEAAAGRPVAVVRAMPNTPALVGAGVAAIAAGAHAGDDDLAWAESILRAVGTVERVPEYQLDAVTGLTGSGPAYVFLFAEALIEGGVLVGLSRAASRAHGHPAAGRFGQAPGRLGRAPRGAAGQRHVAGGHHGGRIAGAGAGGDAGCGPRRRRRRHRACSRARPRVISAVT